MIEQEVPLEFFCDAGGTIFMCRSIYSFAKMFVILHRLEFLKWLVIFLL